MDINNLIAFFTSTDTIFAGTFIGLGFLFGLFTRGLIHGLIKNYSQEAQSISNISTFLKNVSAPIMMLFICVIARTTAIKFFNDNVLYQAGTAFALLWASFIALNFVIHGRFLKLIILLPVSVMIALYVSGLSGPVSKTLNSISFSLGTVHFSILSAIKAIFIVIIFLWGAKQIAEFTSNFISKNLDLQLNDKAILSKISKVIIYTIVFVIMLNTLGIDLSSLAVIGGALGVGIGFGLQKIAANLISGAILVMEKSLKIGDLVELEDGVLGFVREQSARFTLIETFDTKEILIPNEELITNRVVNWSYSNSRGRITVDVGVSYKSDLELCKRLILESAREYERVSSKRAPECYLTEFGDSSVNFKLYFWVDDITKGMFPPRDAVMMTIWKKFKENSVEIPFPQRDVHIKND